MTNFKTTKIKDLEENKVYNGIYLIKDINERLTKNLEPYVNATFMDNSGQVQGNIFNTNLKNTGLKAGDFIDIRFQTNLYLGKLHIKAMEFKRVDNLDKIPLNEFITSYENKNLAYNELIKIARSIEDEDIKDLMLQTLYDNIKAFAITPAAKSFHHNYNGGLLEHTYSMMMLAKQIYGHYTDLKIEYIYAGVLFHDMMKIEEYNLNTIGEVLDYSDKGSLLGHISMGLIYLEKLAQKINKKREEKDIKPIDEKKLLIIQHMVASHHGKLEWGSPVEPAYKEAMILHHLDMMDSEMSRYRTIEKTLEHGEFSDYNYQFKNKVYKI